MVGSKHCSGMTRPEIQVQVLTSPIHAMESRKNIKKKTESDIPGLHMPAEESLYNVGGFR